VRAIFTASSTTWRERKQLLRCIIAEVVVTVRKQDREADLRIIWEGGADTALTMTLTRAGGHFRVTDEDTVELVRRLAVTYDDTTIAVILGRNRHRTATGLHFTKARVKSLRVAKEIPAFEPVTVTPTDDDAVVVGINKAEQLLGVSKTTIYRWLRDGFITGEQLVAGGPWRIRIDDATRAKVVGDVPAGWVDLDHAAATLGVARQTVIDRIARGNIRAVHVNRGRRRGLAIDLGTAQMLPGTGP
jgi:excisionase family DNA binding protein